MSDDRKSIFRVAHNKNYTTVHNHICKDKRLSYKAKGIWLYAFSRPDDWQFYESDIVSQSNEKKYSIKAGLKELEEAGYLVKERRRDKKNQFKGWIYTFYEIPNEIKKSLPKREKPIVGKPQYRENQPLLSTDSLPSTEKKQQQDISPNGSVVVFLDKLRKTGITDKDKQSIIRFAQKNKLSVEDFSNAINYVTAPDFEINTTLTKAIMWALKEKPIMPEPIDEEKNREMAEAAEYILTSNSWNLEALSSKVIFTSKTPTNSDTYEIKFSEHNFKNKLDQILKQCGFVMQKRKLK